ncbi:hypothetical protein DIC66_20255 [Rhodoferax lacus]|uniref:histidine kinase n=1 Tax=Rhodoferax lacus TaxID=2184758 RepID=A0A3E1R7S8_9BURK|nr:ATP-binding protein [Rhodoferax lacus]RFO95092.1 hypothetical protein DIC66_20255 [Rhodoferax lacus]
MAEILLVKSLQRKVTVVTSVAIAAALVLGVNGAQRAEQLEQRQHLDMHLAEVAQTVIEFSRDGATEAASLATGAAPRLYTPPNANMDLSFQVWLKKGPTLLQTNMPLTGKPLMPLEQLGFENGMVDGKPGRMFSLPAADQSYIVQVAEQFEDRDNDTPTLLHYYFLPIALPLLFAMVTTWTLLRRSADALDALVHRLRVLDPKQMQALSIDRPTHEILPVIEEFNTLFQRASQALQSEQRFTSLAAHELRTPLAGIKAQAQLALKARSVQDQQEALQEVISGVSRASHVFDQLIDLTRLDSASHGTAEHFGPVSFELVYQQVLDDQAARARAKGMVLQTQWQAPTVQGAEFAIYLLLRNLLSNAIQYGSEGGRIDITTVQQADELVLCVDDAGKGIPAESRSKAFERFNRLDQCGPDGVGLGLSIVQMVATMHGGTVQLQDSPLGGLRVRVGFPRRNLAAA